MSEALKSHFSAWGEADADKRAEIIRANAGDSFYYVDPNTPAPMNSVDEFLEYLDMFTSQMPCGGAETAAISTHNNHARATVDFTMGGKSMMRGQYFADLDADGKITILVGFTGMGDE
ncbi:MAG: nuclear transport factor 2 family protein [Paracoccaceae bacterium]|nr:nuclear transport factor 2 family protein [Paracoccaceae bacterium]